jgi:hypothetical protein
MASENKRMKVKEKMKARNIANNQIQSFLILSIQCKAIAFKSLKNSLKIEIAILRLKSIC